MAAKVNNPISKQRAAARTRDMAPQSTRPGGVRRRSVRIPLEAGASVRGAVSAPARGPVRWVVLLGHGAGGTLDQPLLVALADGLAARGGLVLRYNFPYAEAGRKAPDRAPALIATVAAAARWLAARPQASGVPLVLGGKSMGGRMASMLVADAAETSPRADGLLLVGYPLHPAGQPGKLRAEHLARIACPMLFLAGTRDPLCDLALLKPVLRRLGRRATLHVVEGGDHSFAIPKSRGVSASDVAEELIETCARWLATLRRRR